MVERGGLENRCGRKSTQGSNPCLSATGLGFPAFETSAQRRLLTSGFMNLNLTLFALIIGAT